MDTLLLIERGLLVALSCGTIVWDWRWNRIPNAFTYPAILAGLVLGAARAFPGALGDAGFVDRLVAVVATFVVLYPFYAGRLLFGGDVKLLMAVGALAGSAFLVAAAFYGALIGGVIALIYLIVGRRRLVAPDAEPTAAQALLLQVVPGRLRPVMGSKMPMGIGLALGVLFTLTRAIVGS